MTNERIAAAWAYHTMQQDWDSLSENARHLYESDVRDIRKALDVLGLEIVEKQADDAALDSKGGRVMGKLIRHISIGIAAVLALTLAAIVIYCVAYWALPWQEAETTVWGLVRLGALLAVLFAYISWDNQ